MKLTPELIRSKLPKRPIDANKGTFGKTLIIAGSKNYPGAAILSVLGAARIGAGLITLATDENTYKVAVPKIPFSTFLSFFEIETGLEKYNSVLIGPGLGIGEETKNLITGLINGKAENKKIILDGDALNIISEINNWFDIIDYDALLTPHPGEMFRLTKLSIEEIQKNREVVTQTFAKKWNKTIILKGAKTVIANPSGQIYKSEFKNSLLASAGTGDVLSGILAGLLAQGLSLLDASICGVYIHGLAGEKLKQKFNDRGATALDLIDKIPEAVKDLTS